MTRIWNRFLNGGGRTQRDTDTERAFWALYRKRRAAGAVPAALAATLDAAAATVRREEERAGR